MSPPDDLRDEHDERAERARFTELFHALSPRVYAYARRRCDPDTAQDVVSDVFLVAWRRFDVVPADPLPWLLVVARNTLADRRRRGQRHDRLTDVLARLERAAAPADAADTALLERESQLAALAALGERDREALLLVAWDGLSNADAAQVAGCSQRAFEVRLSRARARLGQQLARHLDDSPPRSDRPLPVSPTSREATR